MKKIAVVLLSLIMLFSLTACAGDADEAAANPAALLATDAQKASVVSINNIDDGLLYTMDYTADYQLDELLAANVRDVPSLVSFIQSQLLTGSADAAGSVDAGGSAFTVKTAEGNVLYGRNFDYKMDMTAVLIRTAPADGYASIGLADAGWVGYGIGSLDNGKTDLSMAASMPYLIMDGMNEKGFAVSVLKLDGDPTRQDTGKNKVMTTVAMRLLLDRAATVDEAIALLQGYDMFSAMPNANFHFMLSDASGRVVMLEYCINDMQILEQNYATNFYLSPTMDGLGHGQNRYEVLKAALDFKGNVLAKSEAVSLLELVSQPETEESTSMTQWSVLYDLTDLSVQVVIRRDFSKLFTFTLDDISGTK